MIFLNRVYIVIIIYIFFNFSKKILFSQYFPKTGTRFLFYLKYSYTIIMLPQQVAAME